MNSRHHQAALALGVNLRAAAWAADGIIEGLEDTRAEKFALGVQWHPEIGWEGNKFAEAIFRRFVAAAKRGGE